MKKCFTNASILLAYFGNICYYYVVSNTISRGVNMNSCVDYKKLWILLLERKITKPQFRALLKLSSATMTKLNKNELVSMEVLVRICKLLDCDFGDIVELQR